MTVQIGTGDDVVGYPAERSGIEHGDFWRNAVEHTLAAGGPPT